LHYTNFTVSMSTPLALNPNYSTSTLASGSAAYKDLLPFGNFPVHASNLGSMKSDFVALLFLKGEYGPKPYPRKTLVGFTRLHGIAPGENATATVEISVGSIARSDEKGNLVLWPGNYSLVLDIDEKSKWDFVISGEPATLDIMPARAK